MLSNYYTTARRSLVKHKGYSVLNIAGLAVGLACSFLLVLWIQHELSVDRFHEKGERLYQVKINDHGGDHISTWSNVPMPLATALATGYPEVEHAVLTLPITATLRRPDHLGREDGYYAGPGFFDAFTFPFLAGDPATALADPASIVLSETVAEKYFGADWATDGPILGQTLTLDAWQSAGGVLGQAIAVRTPKDYTITGVFADVPHRSTLQFDVVLPAANVAQTFDHVKGWGPRWFALTLALRPAVDAAAFSTKIAPLLREHIEETLPHDVILQPFGDTYLYGAFENGQPAGGRIEQVYLLGLVGLALLLIACINFTNLVTARSQQRVREVGVRKALGAAPANLIQQFLGEAVLTAFLAFLGAAALTALALPLLNTVAGTTLTLASLSAGTWLSFGGIALLTGLLAGSYPAFSLASLSATGVFHRQAQPPSKGSLGLRRGLVVTQFAISTFLIAGTLTIYQQLTYLQNKDLGLNQEGVVMLPLEGGLTRQYAAARQALLQSPAVETLTRTSAHPLQVETQNAQARWAGQEPDENLLFSVLRTDADFARTMQLSLVAGRFFDEAQDAGTLRYVVNASAVQAMGLEHPVGHPFAFAHDLDDAQGELGEIIGVVEDFHTGSLAEKTIGPLVIRYEPSGTHFVLARLAPGQTADALTALRYVYTTFNPDHLFEYTFMEEAYRAYYAEEEVLATLSQVFAGIAIFIACLGLFGLAAFSVQQRTKEIGIRRVLGASTSQVLFILSREFMLLVSGALVLALPLAYWLLQQWLTSFAYRIDLGIGTLAWTAAVLAVATLLTVGWQVRRAVRRDPVHALKHE